MNFVILTIWGILYFIALLAAINEVTTWLYWPHAKELFADWERREISKKRGFLVHGSIVLIAFALLASPWFFESISSGGYEVFNKDGSYVCHIDDSRAIISQSKWDRLTEGKVYCSVDLAEIRGFSSYDYPRAWINLDPGAVIESKKSFDVTFTGNNDHANLIRRLGAMIKFDVFSDLQRTDRLVAKMVGSSKVFGEIKKSVNIALSEKRELTIAEKAELYKLIIPLDSELHDQYGVQIVDISTK